MRIHTAFIPAALIVALLQAAPVCAAAAGSSSTDPVRVGALEQSKAEAATLLARGEAAKAYELYMRLLRTAPDDDDVNLGLARSAAKAKRWNQAVLAYETLLEKHPGEAGLYGELANVYMLLGDREAAERSLAVMRSLDGKSTTAETDEALDILESRYSGFQVHGKIRAGVQYDSNANLGPESNNVQLGMWSLTLDNAKAKESFGGYLGAELDLGWRPYRDSPWWLVADAHGFWRGHAESSLGNRNSQESQWGRGAVGIRHLSASTLAEARFKAEIFDYEFYQHVAACGPEATFLWAATPSLHLIFRGGFEWRDYSRDRPRNGLSGSTGAYARVFFGADNHELLLGGRYLGAGANKRDYRYDGWEGVARVLFKLPYGFELSPSLTFGQEYYQGPATILETRDRRDERVRAGLGLTYRINEAWSLEAGYQYTHNHSTSALYKYDQHFINTGIAWSF